MAREHKTAEKDRFCPRLMEAGVRERKAKAVAVNASPEEKLAEEKRRWLPLDVMDVVWLGAFLFVIREFDIVDAVRYDKRIDQ